MSGRGPAGTLPCPLAAVLLATGPLGAQAPAPAGAGRPAGWRLGYGAAARFGGRLGAFLEASADVVRLGDEGTRDGGLAWTPPLFAGVRWWPEAQAPVGRSAPAAVRR